MLLPASTWCPHSAATVIAKNRDLRAHMKGKRTQGPTAVSHGYGNGGFKVNFTFFLIFQYTFYNELYNINSLFLRGRRMGGDRTVLIVYRID